MVKTAFVDSNNRIIHTEANSRDGRKKVHYVRKRNAEGKFVKAYNRVAHMRKDGRKIRNVMTVPKGVRPANNNALNNGNVTMTGLNNWHKHLFQHLGWMVLAKAKGHGYKVSMYKKSINEFIKSAEKLHEAYTESNRKHDVKVLLKQAKVLRRFSKML